MSISYANLSKQFAQTLRFPEPGKTQTLLAFEVGTNSFWEYSEGVWTAVNKEELKMKVREYCLKIEGNAQLTLSKIRDITEQLAFDVDRHDVLDDGYVAFLDGSWLPDDDTFHPHSPDRFATVKVQANYNNLPKPSDGPLFRKFLDSICVDDEMKPLPEMEMLLSEMFGYCLLSSSERAVAFFLTGKGRNGKGVLSGILQAILGKERVSNMSLEDLTSDKFAVSALVGKRLNIADENNSHREATSTLLKKLIAVDTIQSQRKFENSFSFKPRAKFVFCLNGVPIFDNFDYALKERIIPISFFRSFSQDERDYTLKAKIIKNELPCVVAWAMEGLRRLQKNNLRFTMPLQSIEALNQFEDASSSLSEFYNEFYEPSDFPMPFADFYTEFCTWARESGRKQMSLNRVSREMSDRVGKGRMLRHPITKIMCRGVMVKRRKVVEEKEHDPFELVMQNQ